MHIYNTKVTNIGLPAYISNVLRRAGIMTVRDLLFLDQDGLNQMHGMGPVATAKVLSKIAEYRSKDEGEMVWDLHLAWRKFLERYRKTPFTGVRAEEVFEEIKTDSSSPITEERKKEIIKTLVTDGLIEKRENLYYAKFLSLSDAFRKYSSVLTEKQKTIFQMRVFERKTLVQVGEELNVSKERVMHAQKVAFQKLLDAYQSETGFTCFAEQRYLYLFKTYDVSDERITQALGLSREDLCGISFFCKRRGTKKLGEAVSDLSVDKDIRGRLMPLVKTDYVIADGEMLQISRPALIRHYIRTHCLDETDFPSFVRGYNGFVEALDVSKEDIQGLLIPPDHLRYFKMHVADDPSVLWSGKGTFRCYDTEKVKRSDLPERLLSGYKNTEVSAIKLFSDNQELMNAYDIRNGYELHNLLKKTVPEGAFCGFHCSRMPILSFGTFTRKELVAEVIRKNGPIGERDLYTRLKEEFGYDLPLIRANIIPLVKEYKLGNSYAVLEPGSE